MREELFLNKQQKLAVEHEKGPLLIVAGAGTGKTTVITERVKYLSVKQQVSPTRILAVTFTDKAAQELLSRLDVVMPLGYEEPWLGTFHAMAERILRHEGLAVGLDPGYTIISQVDQWMLIRKHLFEFNLDYYRPLGNPTKFVSALVKFFSRVQDEDISVEELEKFAKSKKRRAKSEEQGEEAVRLEELAGAFRTYEQLKQRESMLDFGDLISKTLKLFRTRKAILKKYQERFEHILVDEFQDTNFAQFQLIKLLAPASGNPNLVVVGDDDQSIYKFRGAAISNILGFKMEYPKAKKVVLTVNYRSTKSILSGAYDLIQNNNPDRLEVKLKINKRLTPERDFQAKEKPTIVQLPSGEAEVDFTLKKILALLAKENYTYKDFAILTRANKQLDPYLAGLRRMGLPYQLIGNRGLFDQSEVRNLMQFLRVVANPDDSVALFQLLTFEPKGIPMGKVLGILHQAKLRRTSLWNLLKVSDDEGFKKVVELIQTAQEKSVREPVSRLLYYFVSVSGYLSELIRQETVESGLKVKNINLFFDKVRRFESEAKETHVADFVETLNLWEEAGENPAQAVIEDIDTVNLLTVHAAKGLEFPVVFVGSLVAGRFPAIDRKEPIELSDELIKETLPEGSGALEEERRLLYVAMTRAKDYLYLTYAFDYGGVRKRVASGFLKETKLSEKKEKEERQLSLLTDTPPPSPKVAYLDQTGRFEIQFLSYSQIDTFLACPLKYKYRYILKVPAEPHHALSFGQTIHTTLHDFHQVEQQGRILSLSEFLFIYEKNFIDEGYESSEHKKERFEAGKKALRKYYRVFREQLGKPKRLEQSFRLRIAGIPFLGKIDRIDETISGYEIVDYKTGEAADQKRVDRDKQLTIYGLAAKEALKLSIARMSLFFVEKGEKVTTVRTDEDYQREREHLEKMVEKIKGSDFKATPGYPFPCKFCEYKTICPFAKKG
ncbi:hypothetical protein A2783_01475 [Microgenomates group bacterium RIFCSPHIGHO2_01_FULL_45_11]|nr:MAG: hypothetical protein A2783_01475 [Microgenomates group bacterium RIFCSPHIGHO2_01_FULL_45_11]